ncbi:MAG TPA: hypothetical protein VFE24_15015 [Pirellulales bacterium]|jgi:hypothetical protein|nr:hypothetical protein [Pirellulales bacterium]
MKRFSLACGVLGLLTFGLSAEAQQIELQVQLQPTAEVALPVAPNAAPVPGGIPGIIAKPVTKPEVKKDDPKKEDHAANDPKAELAKLAAPKADPETITLMLLDGSVITGKLSMKDISVETQFGKLTVPVTSIRSFTPGLTSHPDLSKNMTDLIKDLGSSNFNDRETAQKAILKIGPPARNVLQRYVDDTDTERRTRVKAILDEFDQATSDEDENATQSKVGLQKGDVVETTDFTIVGRISPATFDVATQYGQLNIKLSDIQRGQRIAPQREDVRKSINVEGTNIAQRSFKNTNIKVEKGDKIIVSAEGLITMTPWGNQAVSSPDGAQNYGWYLPNQIAAGALVGRFGNSGPVFKVGSHATITADRAGTLFLAIGMEPNYANQNFPGEYHTKIHVEKKQ